MIWYFVGRGSTHALFFFFPFFFMPCTMYTGIHKSTTVAALHNQQPWLCLRACNQQWSSQQTTDCQSINQSTTAMLEQQQHIEQTRMYIPQHTPIHNTTTYLHHLTLPSPHTTQLEPAVCAVRIIWNRAEPTTTNKKNPITIGPNGLLSVFSTPLLTLPRLLMFWSNCWLRRRPLAFFLLEVAIL